MCDCLTAFKAGRRSNSSARGLVDEPLEILILSPPDIFADMVTRLTMRQAVKNCYDRGGSVI
jgi:hypothetical protein